VKGEGNQQDYGMRIYDTRLGRFLSVDPLAFSFPWYSPYHYAGNTPIQAVDLDGSEPKGYNFNEPYVASHSGTAVKHIPSSYDGQVYETTSKSPVNMGVVTAHAVQDIDGRTYLIYESAMGTKQQWYREYDKTGWKGNINSFQWQSPPDPSKVLTAMTVGPLVTLPAMVMSGFAIGGLSSSVSNLSMDLLVKGNQLFWRYAPTIGVVGNTIAEFLDESGSLAGANQGGRLVSAAIQEGKGLVGGLFKFTNNKTLEILAEKVVEGEGKTLHLKDMIGYIEGMGGKEGANNLKEGIYDVLTKLKEYAKEQGFENLRITYKRVENSSSKTPGHTVDKIFDLKE